MAREGRKVCMECGKVKPALAIEQGDDFCSTACARRHNRMGLGERTDRGDDVSWARAQSGSRRALVASE